MTAPIQLQRIPKRRKTAKKRVFFWALLVVALAASSVCAIAHSTTPIFPT